MRLRSYTLAHTHADTHSCQSGHPFWLEPEAGLLLAHACHRESSRVTGGCLCTRPHSFFTSRQGVRRRKCRRRQLLSVARTGRGALRAVQGTLCYSQKKTTQDIEMETQCGLSHGDSKTQLVTERANISTRRWACLCPHGGRGVTRAWNTAVAEDSVPDVRAGVDARPCLTRYISP